MPFFLRPGTNPVVRFRLNGKSKNINEFKKLYSHNFFFFKPQAVIRINYWQMNVNFQFGWETYHQKSMIITYTGFFRTNIHQLKRLK